MAAIAEDRWEPFGATGSDWDGVPERDGVRVAVVKFGGGEPGGMAGVAAGEKVMIAAHHRGQVDAYAAEFGGLKLQGGQPVAEKEAAKAAFQQRPAAEAPVIVVAIGAGGVGHTLTAARIGIQAEQAWTPGETRQMKKRLHRIGQDRPVDYYITGAEGTIDEHLWSVVTAKQATLDAVLDGRSDEGAADD